MAEKKVEIKVRLTKKEAARLQTLVKRSALSREAYLRHLIGGVVPQEIPPPDYFSLYGAAISGGKPPGADLSPSPDLWRGGHFPI